MTADLSLYLPTTSPPRLYRQYFTDAEIKLLDGASTDSARSEISLIRILISRILASARKLRLTLKHRLSMLTVFCQSAATMASLARFDFKQQGPPPSPFELLFPPDNADEFLDD